MLPIILDSREIDALLDTGASTTHLSLETAEGTFKLQPNSPEMTKTGEFAGAGQTPVYEHTFKTLELQGITIGNPAVYVWDNLEKSRFAQSPHLGSRLSDADERSGVTDMTLGTRELRHLHIYIAYKEQKLYITPASAPPTAEAGSPAPAAASSKDATALH